MSKILTSAFETALLCAIAVTADRWFGAPFEITVMVMILHNVLRLRQD